MTSHSHGAAVPDRHPTVSGAIDRAADAAQRLLEDRIGLARLDLESLLKAASLGILGGCLMLGGWTILLVAAYHVLAPHLETVPTLGALAGLNFALGAGALLGARRGPEGSDG
jgi:hypothetical protein